VIDFAVPTTVADLQARTAAFTHGVVIPADPRDRSDHGLDPDRVVDRAVQLCSAAGVSKRNPAGPVPQRGKAVPDLRRTHHWAIARRALRVRPEEVVRGQLL
jgi:hypothetical protein